MVRTWAEFLLENYKIRRSDELPFMGDAIENIRTLDRNLAWRVHTLNVFFRDIESLDEILRDVFEFLNPKLEFTMRRKDEIRALREKGGENFVEILLREVGAKRDAPKVVYGYSCILEKLYTQWDNVAKLMWCFYESPMSDDKELKLHKVCSSLRADNDLNPFFVQAGIDFNKHGEAYFREDSPLIQLIRYRNRTTHNLTAAPSTIDLEFTDPRWNVVRYWDHHAKAFKDIRVVSLKTWQRIAQKSYVHFVECYNTLLDIFQQTVEKRGRI